MQVQSTPVSSSYLNASAAFNGAEKLGASPNKQQIEGGLALRSIHGADAASPLLSPPKIHSSQQSAALLSQQMDDRQDDFLAGQSVVSKLTATPMQQWGNAGLEMMSRIMDLFAQASLNRRKDEQHHQSTMKALSVFKQESLRTQATDALATSASGAALSVGLSTGGSIKTIKSIGVEGKSIRTARVDSEANRSEARRRAVEPVTAGQGTTQQTVVPGSQDVTDSSQIREGMGAVRAYSHESALNKSGLGRQYGQMISELSRPANSLADAARSTLSLKEQSIQTGLDATLEIEKGAMADAQDMRQKNLKVVEEARQAMRSIASSNMSVAAQISSQIRV